MTSKHTPGPWFTTREGFSTVYVEARLRGSTIQEVAACGPTEAGSEQQEANARLIAAAPELLAELQRAQEFIDSIRQELHQRRVADWYPEGAHNAADQMSEDMRLLGNACADFDTSAVIAKATGDA